MQRLIPLLRRKKADLGLADGKSYMLSRSYLALCRLNLQHYMWKESLGFNIHPSIPVAPDSVIADVATGTAIWLLDAAHSLPTTVQLDGLDLDLSPAPHSDWLPPNVSLRQWDLFTEPPADIVGKYDIVHVRLLVLVVQNRDPTAVIRQLGKLLKPGGYLQWDELDMPHSRVTQKKTKLPTSGSAAAAAAATADDDGVGPKDKDADEEKPTQNTPLHQIQTRFRADGRHDWAVTTLPGTLEAEGFQVSSSDTYADPDYMMTVAHDNCMAVMEEFVLRLSEEGETGAVDELMGLVARSREQASRTGALLSYPRVVYVARKKKV